MTSLSCQVHKTHQPRSHVNERHHIHPLGYHGPDVASNIVVVCATGHNSIHQLLEKMLKAGTAELPHHDLLVYTKGEKKVATTGFLGVMAYAESLVPR
jgi:hypothetical protein